jgi:ribosomal protein L37AE/L43A
MKLDRCPKCHADAVETHKGFGGFWKRLCNMCGHEVDSGRTSPGESE